MITLNPYLTDLREVLDALTKDLHRRYLSIDAPGTHIGRDLYTQPIHLAEHNGQWREEIAEVTILSSCFTQESILEVRADCLSSEGTQVQADYFLLEEACHWTGRVVCRRRGPATGQSRLEPGWWRTDDFLHNVRAALHRILA